MNLNIAYIYLHKLPYLIFSTCDTSNASLNTLKSTILGFLLMR